MRVLPGIPELLAELAGRQDVIVGLLTGNFRAAAQLKIAMAGLDRFSFPIGAFAEDGEVRTDLVPVARRQFEAMAGHLPNATIVVGDTPGDIGMAKATECRVLAVATGQYSLAQLQVEGPDMAVADLSNAKPLYDLIAR
jgi:phosphoglycolate phosphatase-like HAD superfamily hydrolase